MSDYQSDDGNSTDDSEFVTERRLHEVLNERFDVEAVAQMFEQLDISRKLSIKLAEAFQEVRFRSGKNSGVLEEAQREIRSLIMDVALLKRTLSSLGHIGVMERLRIEKELVRELFPPSQPRVGAGVVVISEQRLQGKHVDCENRLPICKAACCRVFGIGLSSEEVDSDEYDWDPRRPYQLRKNRSGCVHLKSGGCACVIYNNRPRVCQAYSCKNDKRIWKDYDNRIINPDLAKRLQPLDVSAKLPLGTIEQDSKTEIDRNQMDQEVSTSQQSKGTAAITTSKQADGQHVDGPKAGTSAPNFDELRKLMIPLPDDKFAPPENRKRSDE